MVINTMGWVDGLGFDLVLHAIEAFKPTDIITLAQDRLYSQIYNELRCGPQPLSMLPLSPDI